MDTTHESGRNLQKFMTRNRKQTSSGTAPHADRPLRNYDIIPHRLLTSLHDVILVQDVFHTSTPGHSVHTGMTIPTALLCAENEPDQSMLTRITRNVICSEPKGFTSRSNDSKIALNVVYNLLWCFCIHPRPTSMEEIRKYHRRQNTYGLILYTSVGFLKFTLHCIQPSQNTDVRFCLVFVFASLFETFLYVSFHFFCS